MKRTLVLSGGGTKGIYQVGVLKAMKDIGEYHFDKVVGVSVGSLNAAMIVQGDLDKLEYMYDHLIASQIVNGYVPTDLSIKSIMNDREGFLTQLQYYLKEHGIDIHPFYEHVEKYYDPKKFFQSDIDFALVTALNSDHSGYIVEKEMMKEKGIDWLVASCSAYPAFPVKEIDGVEYIDGGYYDNSPIDYALRDGADEVVAIEMGVDTLHPLYRDKKIVQLIHPHYSLYDFLCFDQEKMQKAKIIGYNDAMKFYKKYDGYRYTFKKFALPIYFNEYERAMLIKEVKIKNATSINERFRSEHVISDKLMEQMHLDSLSDKKIFFGMIDALMDLCEMDDTKVYSISQAKKEILANFAQCAYEDYPYKPSLNPLDMMDYLKSLDKKTIVSIILHSYFYPEHSFISENIILTVYPFESAMADFLYIMMMHI